MSSIEVSQSRVNRNYDRDYGQAGLIVPQNAAYPAVGALVATQGYVVRFVPSRNMTITAIKFVLSTAAGADDACDVGIYDSSLARIVSSGATSGKLNATAGVQSISITATNLKAGTVYYAGFSSGAQGGSAAQVLLANFGSQYGVRFFGDTASLVSATSKSSGHPLPSTMTVNHGLASYPLLCLAE